MGQWGQAGLRGQVDPWGKMDPRRQVGCEDGWNSGGRWSRGVGGLAGLGGTGGTDVPMGMEEH